METETRKISNYFGAIAPFAILIAYCASVRITDNYTAANYIAVIVCSLMSFNHKAIAIGNSFVLLIFSFSWLYGGYFLERAIHATAVDITYVIIITILNIISVAIYLNSEDEQKDKKEYRNVTYGLTYANLAIAILRLMFIF
jgi:hypothetical protein